MQPLWTIVRPLAFVFSLFAVFSGCDESELPPVSQKGARTYGFKFNGEIYEGSLVIGSFYQDRLVITANRSGSGHNKHISRIVVEDYRGEDSLILNTGGNPSRPGVTRYFFVIHEDEDGNGTGHRTDSCCTITLYIDKFNTVEGIVAGRFEGSVINLYDPTDTIQITEGRFDATM